MLNSPTAMTCGYALRGWQKPFWVNHEFLSWVCRENEWHVSCWCSYTSDASFLVFRNDPPTAPERTSMKFTTLMTAALLTAGFATTAGAQTVPTLKKIADSNKITVSYREA